MVGEFSLAPPALDLSSFGVRFCVFRAQSSRVCVHFATCHVYHPQIFVRVILSAIQTFLCGGSRLPFGSGAIPCRKPLTAPSDPFKDAEIFRVRVLYIYLSGRYQEFPFGNEGQFAFVNPLRRD